MMRRYVDGRLRAHGLSLSRMKLLGVLDRAGPARPGLVATELGLAARSVTDAVDSLERDGLVERRPDPLDRRAVLVAITRQGTRALRTAHKLREGLLDEAFASVSQQRRDALIAILADVRGALDAL